MHLFPLTPITVSPLFNKLIIFRSLSHIYSGVYNDLYLLSSNRSTTNPQYLHPSGDPPAMTEDRLMLCSQEHNIGKQNNYICETKSGSQKTIVKIPLLAWSKGQLCRCLLSSQPAHIPSLQSSTFHQNPHSGVFGDLETHQGLMISAIKDFFKSVTVLSDYMSWRILKVQSFGVD